MRLELRAALAALLVGPVAAAAQTAPAVPGIVITPFKAPVPAPTSPVTPPSDAALADTLTRAQALFNRRDCAGVLALLDPLAAALSPGDRRTAVQRARLACLLPAGRGAEIDPLLAELVKVSPRDPAIRYLAIAVAMDRRQFPLAAERLAAAAEDEPAVLKQVTVPLVRQLRQAIAQDPAQSALRDRLDLALALAAWSSGDADVDDDFRSNAVEVLARRGDSDQARGVLAQIEAPEPLVEMALVRVYEPVWHDIEGRLGAHGALAVDSLASNRLEAYARQPEGERTLRDAVRSFYLLGRLDDAASLGSQVTIADGMSEDLVNVVRYQAQSLASLGRRDEAIERLKGFSTINLATAPYAVGGLILYLEMLDDAGRDSEALAAARVFGERGKPVLNPWGRSWFDRSEACAMAHLGQAVQAGPVRDRLLAAAVANPAAVTEGLMCLGRTAEAAKIAVAALGTVDGAEQLAVQFQPPQAFWAPTTSRNRGLWTALLVRPDVKLAFNKVARLLPRSLWPDPAPRAVPRSATAPGWRRIA